MQGNHTERFKTLAGIAALHVSGGSPTWEHWLDLLKVWLVETASDFINCCQIESAGGVKVRIPAEAKTIYHPQWPKISPDDPRSKRYTLCTIRAVCEASANYCLELASLSLGARTGQKSATSSGLNNGVQTQAIHTEELRSSTQVEEKEEVARARASTVARLIGELNILKPQMLEDEQEYDLLQNRYPGYLCFQIAKARPDLKMKILFIRGSARHIRLAQELAAAHYGLSLETMKAAWKHQKPVQYKRRTKARPNRRADEA